MPEREDDLLTRSGLPIFFEIGNWDDLELSVPANRHGQSVRTWARSLTVMQKEAIVVSARSGKAWRLASDEGPYLDGHDKAPCPLSFLTTGMVASYMTEIQALAKQRDITINDITLVQDNFYTMEGSAMKGTMTGGALPVELEVQIDCDAADGALNELLLHAVHASPLNGLMRKMHVSLFTLTMNAEDIGVGEVAAIDGPAEKDPGDRFPMIRPRNDGCKNMISQVAAVDENKATGGSSLQASQSRTLNCRGICRVLPDGSKEIIQELYQPPGSSFRFLCDETAEFGGQGRAPDAATYISAGIAFCFMTQLGRYAKILKKNLSEYKVIQDTHFSPGGASGGTGKPGDADAVETHVYLDTSEGEAFARLALDMGEKTCFLHAFCRTELKTKVKIKRV